MHAVPSATPSIRPSQIAPAPSVPKQSLWPNSARTGLLELRDPRTGEVVFSCRPTFTGVLFLKTATRSAVRLSH